MEFARLGYVLLMAVLIKTRLTFTVFLLGFKTS